MGVGEEVTNMDIKGRGQELWTLAAVCARFILTQQIHNSSSATGSAFA